MVAGEVTSATTGNSGVGGAKPLRADARRNIAKVREAAEEVFSLQGLGAPVDEIAARAGVGVGTVYRHFPTKEALVDAIVRARLDALLARAEQLRAAPDPREALFGYVSELVNHAFEKKGLMEQLARAGMRSEELHAGARPVLEQAIAALLKRAQAAGAVRRDITCGDFSSLVMGTCMAACQHGDLPAAHKLLGVLRDGLCTAPGPAPRSKPRLARKARTPGGQPPGASSG
jgi:AcrR family transcriptional regulator